MIDGLTRIGISQALQQFLELRIGIDNSTKNQENFNPNSEGSILPILNSILLLNKLDLFKQIIDAENDLDSVIATFIGPFNRFYVVFIQFVMFRSDF